MIDNHLSGVFKMAASRFVKVTDEEINCLQENAYFSNNHLCNKLKQLTIIVIHCSHHLSSHWLKAYSQFWETVQISE